MSLENNDIEQLIEDYFEGNLSISEKANFESLLKVNDALKAEFELEKQARSIIEDSVLIEWEDKISMEMDSMRSSRKWKKTGIGTLLILGIAGFAVLSTSEQQKNDPIIHETDYDVQTESDRSIEIIDTVVEKTATQQTPPTHSSISKNHTEKGSAKSTNTSDTIPTETPDTTQSSFATEMNEKTNQEDNSSHESQSTSTSQTTQVDPCTETPLRFETSTTPSCTNEATGQLTINITHGTAPYTRILLPDELELSDNEITDLEANTYTVFVIDGNECESKSEIVIESINCYKPEKGFNPDFETWQYNGIEQEVLFMIYNKAGKLIVRQDVIDSFEWDGNDDTGERVPSGSYIYMMEHKGQLIKKGTLSVIY